MAEYHGDLMYRVGNVYQRQDDRNYPIALILLFFFGFVGLHRFFLNDIKAGFAYMATFTITILLGIVTFNFTLLLWYLGIASITLLVEFFYFIYCWSKQ